jgi:hypothetical protein
MYVAKNNPNPMICITSDDVDKTRKMLKEDYNFYSRVLRVVYPKKRLRNSVLAELKKIEDTTIHLVPMSR